MSTTQVISAVFAVFAGVILTSIATGQTATAARTADRFAPINHRMEEFAAAGRIAGSVTLVAQKGEAVHLAAVGFANFEDKKPIADDAIFRIMSMTKPMTATAIMMLVDEGKIALDDPVAKYIPAFANAKTKDGAAVEGLTIRRLMTHSSGLPADQAVRESLEATANALAARPFEFQPGQRWLYGPGLNVAARILEVASGKKYDEFMAERVFQPLEMKDTTFFPTEAQRPRVANLYRPGPEGGAKMVVSPRQAIAVKGETQANPSGGLYSTARDVMRFYQTILDGGEWKAAPGGPRRIVSADAVKQMTANQTGEIPTNWGRSNSWGLGWCLINEPRRASNGLSPGSFGHGGLYGTQVWVDPTRQALFILMIQSIDFEDSDSSSVRREFQRLAAAALDSTPATATTTPVGGAP